MEVRQPEVIIQHHWPSSYRATGDIVGRLDQPTKIWANAQHWQCIAGDQGGVDRTERTLRVTHSNHGTVPPTDVAVTVRVVAKKIRKPRWNTNPDARLRGAFDTKAH